jgi:hypothetical protein
MIDDPGIIVANDAMAVCHDICSNTSTEDSEVMIQQPSSASMGQLNVKCVDGCRNCFCSLTRDTGLSGPSVSSNSEINNTTLSRPSCGDDVSCDKVSPGIFSSCSLTSLLSIADSDGTEILSPSKLLDYAETKDNNITVMENRTITEGLPEACLRSPLLNNSKDSLISIQSLQSSHATADELENISFEPPKVSRKRKKRLPTVVYVSESDSDIDTVKDTFWRDLEEGKLVQQPYIDLYTKVRSILVGVER